MLLSLWRTHRSLWHTHRSLWHTHRSLTGLYSSSEVTIQLTNRAKLQDPLEAYAMVDSVSWY